MTTNQILQLDCRSEENKEIIQKVLKKIGPLSKYSVDETVPFEKVEKLVTVLSKRYNMRVREFVPDVWSNSNETIWRATVINDTNLQMIKMVYGLSVYEVFAKVSICMYNTRDMVGRREVDIK